MESPAVVEIKVGTAEVDTRPLTAFLVNPHKVLGIPKNSTPEHVHSAYVILLHNNRPDATMPEEQWQKCMERRTAIEAAYQRLVPWADAGLCFGTGYEGDEMCQNKATQTLRCVGYTQPLWTCDTCMPCNPSINGRPFVEGWVPVPWEAYDMVRYKAACEVVNKRRKQSE